MGWGYVCWWTMSRGIAYCATRPARGASAGPGCRVSEEDDAWPRTRWISSCLWTASARGRWAVPVRAPEGADGLVFSRLTGLPASAFIVAGADLAFDVYGFVYNLFDECYQAWGQSFGPTAPTVRVGQGQILGLGSTIRF